MITRKEYMNDSSNLFHAYYSQFINSGVIHRVTKYIGLNRIRNSTDDHLNDIPLKEWDNIAICDSDINTKMRACGDYPTLSGLVCIAKTCARNLIKTES